MSSEKVVLLIGSGGREHALAWKLSQSPRVGRILAFPGNAGTQTTQKTENVSTERISLSRFESIVKFCTDEGVCLVVVGPEDPLANGLVDYLTDHNIPSFGPKQAAAKIEASKGYSKELMRRHGIPTAAFQVFHRFDEAEQFIQSCEWSGIVVKADGLAAGKGVIVSKTKEEAVNAAKSMLNDKEFGEQACASILVEERIYGQEISALCFTDGKRVECMPLSQDNKRLKDGDEGPNTGGMGAFAPFIFKSPEIEQRIKKEIEETVLQRVIDGMKSEGIEYRGVLYAGLMLSEHNQLQVLEFNCRFGDPETQVILPLLKSDLYTVCEECAAGKLVGGIKWSADTYATTVVLVSGAENGNHFEENKNLIIHAGTKLDENGKLLTSGGRVINAVGFGPTLLQSRNSATKLAGQIHFDGAFYRRDIALRQCGLKLTYADAGVDISEGNRLVDLIKPVAVSTKREGCDTAIGSFGCMVDLSKAGYKEPVLIMGTDGVGTKLKVAEEVGRHDTIGIDLVAMCANDVLCNGGEPLAFLDYYATGKLSADKAAEVVRGIAEGCKLANCSLIGGETAELPGMFKKEQEYDVAGFVVGVMEKSQPLLPLKDQMKEGNVVIGLASSGLHSNGYSLARTIVTKSGLSMSADAPWDTTRKSLGDHFLEPTKIYVRSMLPLIKRRMILGAAHITGGGLLENVARVLPTNLKAELNQNDWETPRIFDWLESIGGVERNEMHRTFNCGIGMVLIVPMENEQTILDHFKDQQINAQIIGSLKIRSDDEAQVSIKARNESCIKNGWSLCSTNGTAVAKGRRVKVAILISGTGTNMESLIAQANKPDSHCEICLVISNKSSAKGLKTAAAMNIPTKFINHKDYTSREQFDAVIDYSLREFGAEIVCLAGFMRIVSSWFVDRWSGQLLNVHPSLLPKFKGAHAHRDLLAAKEPVTGCTVHYVNAELDSGEIILQSDTISVRPDDTEETLSDRVKLLEHVLYPKAMEKVAEKILSSSC